MIPIITPAQATAWDAAAEQDGRPLRMLMESAGRAVADMVLWNCSEEAHEGVLVATGRGNNGGDGWVAARLLHRLGYPVTVVSLGDPTRDEATDARRVALADGVQQVAPDAPWPNCGVIIDAIIGGGSRGAAPNGAAAELLARIAALDLPIVAVDAPSGLDLATGAHQGAAAAAHTVTFGGLRRGHLRARDLIGDLHVTEIGLPAADQEWPVLFDLVDARAAYRPFVADAHKGTRGRVVIVGGREGMTGAARLVARAAFASGAGLVHVATDTASAIILAAAEPDVQVLCTRWDGAPEASLLALVRSADVVIVGPGLGREPGTRALIEGVIAHAKRLVLDADGLQAFAGDATALATLLVGIPTILTPHPGEFRALFPDIPLDDPWEAAHAAAMRMGQVVLLKGVPTVIASRGSTTLTVARGNPGLATGGSGDVLSGIIGALWCRHAESREAAALGAVAHGDAADRVARQMGVVGMRPMDVIGRLAEVWHELALPDTEFRDLLLYLPRPVTQ